MLRQLNMKFFILALIAVAILSVFILFLQGGEKFEISPSLDEEFRLKVGEKALVRGVELVLVINKVIEDSRCPINVYCFWSG
ncbi:MAG: hypothetical protein QXT51_04810, partial [Nitrososphaerota archaeon]